LEYTEKELLELFNISATDVCSYILTKSFSKDAKYPVIFSHYTKVSPNAPFESEINNRDFYTVFIFLSNSHRFITKNGIFHPSFGEALLFASHEEFSSVISTASSIDYYEINFFPDFFETVPIPTLFKKPFHNRPAQIQNLITPSSYNKENLIHKLKELEHVIISKYECAEDLAYSYILQIMEIIFHSCFSSDAAPRTLSDFSPEHYSIISYIHENFHTLESVDELCKNFNISYKVLEKMFKKYFSCSPMTYITNLRISYAKYLLEKGLSITDVCFESGFNNYTYFITKFKEIVGKTPAKFRKSLLENTIKR